MRHDRQRSSLGKEYGFEDWGDSGVSAMNARIYPGIMPTVSALWNTANRASHEGWDRENTTKVISAYMRMRRPDLFILPHPFLCPTLLLFPLIDLRPETDSARRIETRVCH